MSDQEKTLHQALTDLGYGSLTRAESKQAGRTVYRGYREVYRLSDGEVICSMNVVDAWAFVHSHEPS